MPDILVVGSLNADLVVRTPRFPAPGETLEGEDLAIFPGGKGANQAVAAARQGAQVAMVGRVGSDSFGPLLTENLRANQVDVTHVRTARGATGTAVILVEASGQNSIVLSPGANRQVGPEDLDALEFEKASLLLLQFEIPLATVQRAASLARARGARVLLNPAPAQAIPEALLAEVDILIPNESELVTLSGRPVGSLDEVEAAARSLLARGPSNVIVTLGPEGALLVSAAGAVHLPGYPVEAVDTTAAGDAFIGGLAAALLQGASPTEAVRRGNASGALAATRPGAQPSLPSGEEVQAFLERQEG